MAADRVALEVEVDVHVLAEATRVVVSVRFGVTECFQDAVGLKKNVLDSVQNSNAMIYGFFETLNKDLMFALFAKCFTVKET